MTVSILRISKFGPQPLLIEWSDEGVMQTAFHSAIVLPSQDEHPGYRHVASLRFRAGRDSKADFEDELKVTEKAARLLATEYAEALASNAKDRAAVAVEPMDDIALRAAHSIGRYPGLASMMANVPSTRSVLSKIADAVEFERLTRR